MPFQKTDLVDGSPREFRFVGPPTLRLVKGATTAADRLWSVAFTVEQLPTEVVSQINVAAVLGTEGIFNASTALATSESADFGAVGAFDAAVQLNPAEADHLNVTADFGAAGTFDATPALAMADTADSERGARSMPA